MEEIVNSQSNLNVMLFAFAFLLAFFLLFGVFIVSWRLSNRPNSLSPYSGMPLRSATNLSYYSGEKVVSYMHSYHQFDNRVFNLRKAAFCRETGRLFPDCMTWYGSIKVDWSFLQKRYPGTYVSWGSLTHKQQEAVRSSHGSLDGFQTAFSSSNPSPRLVEPEYAFAKPGPLYVDLEARVLLGWKIVPGTEIEVLIVQKPTKQSFT